MRTHGNSLETQLLRRLVARFAVDELVAATDQERIAETKLANSRTRPPAHELDQAYGAFGQRVEALAARDFCGKEPQFAATVALLALSSLLAGGGFDPSVSEFDDAVKHLLAASRQIGEVEWALRELGKLAERQCAAGREPFQHAIQAAPSRWHPGEPNL